MAAHPPTLPAGAESAKVAARMPVQFGTADSANFEDMTWTFAMPEGYRVFAGHVAIVPRETYDELLEALQWMADTFGDRNRLPKVLEAAAALHKARSALAKAGAAS